MAISLNEPSSNVFQYKAMETLYPIKSPLLKVESESFDEQIFC